MLRNSRSAAKRLKETIDHSHAVAESRNFHAIPIRDSGPQATDRRACFDFEMAIAFPDSAADRNDRQRIGGVRIRIAHSSAIKEERVIQKRSAAIFDRS